MKEPVGSKQLALRTGWSAACLPYGVVGSPWGDARLEISARTEGRVLLVTREAMAPLLARLYLDPGQGLAVREARDVTACRGRARECGGAVGLCAERLGDLLLIAGELAANLVQHARDGGAFYAWERRGTAGVVAMDRGPGIARENVVAAVTEMGWSTKEEGGGRGLPMVAQLATQVWLCTDERGTTVLAEVC